MVRVVAMAVLALVVAVTARPARAEEAVRAEHTASPSFASLEPGATPSDTYALNAFGLIHHEVSAWPPTLVFGGTWWRVTRGKFRHATSYVDFFQAVGRPDLAADYKRRRILANTLIWGGLAAEVGGVVLAVTGLMNDGFGTRAKVGLGLFAGGFVASAVGATIQHPDVSEEEARAMVADYNRRLRLHLGLQAGAPTVGLRGRW
jgi:hypothetical protein